MFSTVAPGASSVGKPPLDPGTRIESPSGKVYSIEETLFERLEQGVAFRVYRASHQGVKYVLKTILPGDFDYNVKLQKLADSPHVRTLVDSIPDQHLFVFPYREFNLQCVDTTVIPPACKKQILRDALTGLAALHDKRIFHTDIKPSNIMFDVVDPESLNAGLRNVEIIDLEAAVILPPGSSLGHRLTGNHFWRSPEAWARGVQNTHSDIFSFGLVAIFVWLDRMVFCTDEAKAAEDPSDMILRMHLSYFTSDAEDFQGFIDYHDGEQAPFVQRMIGLLQAFNDGGRSPFSRWYPVDSQFKDLVCRMTYLDPKRRITAREALDHPWFAAD